MQYNPKSSFDEVFARFKGEHRRGEILGVANCTDAFSDTAEKFAVFDALNQYSHWEGIGRLLSEEESGFTEARSSVCPTNEADSVFHFAKSAVGAEIVCSLWVADATVVDMDDNDIDKKEAAAMETAHERSGEPHLRDVLKREHDAGQTKPHSELFELWKHAVHGIMLADLERRRRQFKALEKTPTASRSKRDGPDMDR